MRIKYIILMFAALLAFSSCGEKKKKSYDEIAMSGLTTRTENLKTNLKLSPTREPSSDRCTAP